MGRRAYGKFWARKFRDGPIHQQTAAVKGTWIELFSLVLDSTHADDGIIQVDHDCGYTDDQLAKLCSISLSTWENHKGVLEKIGEIRVLQANRIQWLHWHDTQPEYRRQKKYREAVPETSVTKVTTQSYNTRLQHKVTPKSYREK